MSNDTQNVDALTSSNKEENFARYALSQGVIDGAAGEVEHVERTVLVDFACTKILMEGVWRGGYIQHDRHTIKAIMLYAPSYLRSC